MIVNTKGGLWWLAWFIAGPTLWAATFNAVYALHGLGCSFGWPAVEIGPLDLHRLAMGIVWLAGVGVVAVLLVFAPAGPEYEKRLPRLGLWIGLVAIVYTLLPVVVTTSC
ncbi:MAG: hypothetical protein ACK4GT_04040 [Pararhodobacter sp.]